jgi:histone deacetylase complex subunit SAP18
VYVPIHLPITHPFQRAADFANAGKEPAGEVQIYTWKDATLRELTELVKGVNSASTHRSARLSFAFVYPDKTGKAPPKRLLLIPMLGRPIVRPVGYCWSNPRRVDRDDNKTLDELRFETGDFLDISVAINER